MPPVCVCVGARLDARAFWEVINPHYFKLKVCAQVKAWLNGMEKSMNSICSQGVRLPKQRQKRLEKAPSGEFVHGDLGRTRPSMRSFLNGQVEILQLDVEGVEEAED
ncbi:unnamed protein product [Durusdinium trenchii]|uniref:tRNA pseudouridine(55) synthase n=1 Tax=Durusdinium trenchii TaxID=1381693 RepID=A0ABP0I7H8_9DINO